MVSAACCCPLAHKGENTGVVKLQREVLRLQEQLADAQEELAAVQDLPGACVGRFREIPETPVVKTDP